MKLRPKQMNVQPADSHEGIENNMNNENCINSWDCTCCHNELNLDKLCVKKAKIKKACIRELNLPGTFCAKLLSSPQACIGQIMAQRIDAINSCMTDLNVMNECVQNLTATTIGVSNLIANNLCVPGPLKVANLLNCGKYRANVVYSTLTSYILGTDINFDVILDDPNGNITLAPTTYHVPVSGYYNVNFQFNQQNLVPTAGFGPILGVPTANPQLYVNGILVREVFSSFLSFYQQQKTSLNTILSLKVGDIVQMRYKILALDQLSGVIEVPGTVDSIGDGTDKNTSQFKIHMLSVDCGTEMPCAPSIPCQPCTPMVCTPCIPSENCDCGCQRP